LQDMRYAPADKILALQAESQVGVSAQGVRTPPLIDGYFTVSEKSGVLERHEYNDVPILAGSNGDDIDANQNPLTRAKTVAEFQSTARELYGANADQFLRLYPAKKDADVYAAAHAAARENGMLKASRTCAQAQAKYAKSPAYISLFAHKHPYAAGVKIADQNPDTIGAYHTADVPYWFGTFDAFNLFRTTRSWTDNDRALSNTMLHTLIAFANTGSPEVKEFKWPAWSARNEQYAVFGDTISAQRLQTARMDWLAGHPPATLPSTPPPRATPRD
jgi:para-nitrobenzyl esterase